MAASDVRVLLPGASVLLPGASVLVVVEGRVRVVLVCGEDSAGTDGEGCEDVSGGLTDITTLYRDHPFPLPRSSTSMRSAIYINQTLDSIHSPLYLQLSKSKRVGTTKYADMTPLMSVPPTASLPSATLPAHPTAGVYLWRYYVPAGVDRYFDLSLHATPAAASSSYQHPVFVHFSSIPADGETSEEDGPWHEDTFISQLNISTVVRYYRRPYARYATAFIVLPPINSSTSSSSSCQLSLSLSSYSYLRTLFLQLPIATHFLLAAFLLILAAQHRVLHTQQRFPHIHQLLFSLSVPALALLLLVSFGLFAVLCPGTQYHARAFYDQSAVVASGVDWPVLQLWMHARLWNVVKSNETGVVCFVLFMACTGCVVVVQLLLWLLFTALPTMLLPVRRVVGAFPVPYVVMSAWHLLVLAVTVGIVSVMFWHVDAAMGTHFHVSVLASLAPFIHTIGAPLSSSFVALLHPSLPPSLLSFYSLYPDTVHLTAIFILFLVAQFCQWDHTRPSLCAYQLSCTTLAVFAFLLTIPHLLTFLSLPATQPSAPLMTVSALHLVLLVCSSAVPQQSPVLQSVVWIVYGVTLVFASDASLSLQSLYVVYAVVMLCYLPHAVRCSVTMVLDAFVALQGLPKAPRSHVE